MFSYKEKNRFQLNNERPRAIKFSGEKGSVGESKLALWNTSDFSHCLNAILPFWKNVLNVHKLSLGAFQDGHRRDLPSGTVDPK